MKFKILGSGGAIPTPRIMCECKFCRQARTVGAPFKKNSSCAYVEDIETLIDCPEDISDSINTHNIKKIKRLFITHWHPDHTFGLRPLLTANYNYHQNFAEKKIDIYLSESVFKKLKTNYPSIQFFRDTQKLCNIIFIDDGDVININNKKIKVIGYNGKNSDNYAFMFFNNSNSLLYSPCDTINFNSLFELKNKITIHVTECGIFDEECITEITFSKMMERIKILAAKKVYLTHIEEVEIEKFGYKKMEELKETYSDTNYEYCVDGMTIIF